MRVLYLLATAIIRLLGCPPGNSQIEIRTEDHSCEGTNGWDTPACQSAWQANISAVSSVWQLSRVYQAFVDNHGNFSLAFSQGDTR